MASLLRLVFLSCILASINGTFDFDGSLEDPGLESHFTPLHGRQSSEMLRATLDVSSIIPPEIVKVWPYEEDNSKLTFNDCFPNIRPQREASFAILEADDGTKYRGHMVKSEEQMCFRDYYTYAEGSSLKQCLEMARQWSAPSFHYDAERAYCQLFKDWRYTMYKNCRRGSSEKMYYLQEEEPADHKPCRGVQVIFKSTYTSSGSVMITGTTKRDYCGCDIDKITISYLDTTVEMDIIPETPTFTYTYPLASVNAWNNFTTIIVYSRDSIVAKGEYVPSEDMF